FFSSKTGLVVSSGAVISLIGDLNLSGLVVFVDNSTINVNGDLDLSGAQLTSAHGSALNIDGNLFLSSNSTVISFDPSSQPIAVSQCVNISGELVINASSAPSYPYSVTVLRYECLQGSFERISVVGNDSCAKFVAQPAYSFSELVVEISLDR